MKSDKLVEPLLVFSRVLSWHLSLLFFLDLLSVLVFVCLEGWIMSLSPWTPEACPPASLRWPPGRRPNVSLSSFHGFFCCSGCGLTSWWAAVDEEAVASGDMLDQKERVSAASWWSRVKTLRNCFLLFIYSLETWVQVNKLFKNNFIYKTETVQINQNSWHVHLLLHMKNRKLELYSVKIQAMTESDSYFEDNV